MKKLLLLVLMLAFFMGGGSLLSLAHAIEIESQSFPLGSVQAVWDKDQQSLVLN